jgi:hypothetical protein
VGSKATRGRTEPASQRHRMALPLGCAVGSRSYPSPEGSLPVGRAAGVRAISRARQLNRPSARPVQAAGERPYQGGRAARRARGWGEVEEVAGEPARLMRARDVADGRAGVGVRQRLARLREKFLCELRSDRTKPAGHRRYSRHDSTPSNISRVIARSVGEHSRRFFTMHVGCQVSLIRPARLRLSGHCGGHRRSPRRQFFPPRTGLVRARTYASVPIAHAARPSSRLAPARRRGVGRVASGSADGSGSRWTL